MKHVTSKNERDRLMIEALIFRYGQLSRAEIHELTHVQRSEISRMVRELLAEGRLLPAGRADNPMGRKQVLLRLNEEFRFVLAVGFDDENALAAILDLHLLMRSSVREPALLDQGQEGLTRQLLALAHQAVAKAGVDPKLLVGIGVAGSGLVNSRDGVMVMSSTIEFCQDFHLQKIFEKEFGIPTAVENITRAKTVAERGLSTSELAQDMIYVEYGRTGIGAGVIINGKLFYGAGYAAGEFGHTHITEGGPACKCGSFGCLEAIAGAAALQSRVRKAVAEGGTSSALALAEGDLNKITGRTVLQAAGQGDKICAAIVEQAGNYLGVALANLVNLFNPAVIVIDQRLSLAGVGLLDQLKRLIQRKALNHSAKGLTVRFGSLGSEASLLGAGRVALENHFEIPALKLPRFMIETVKVPRRKTPGARTAA
ncbi:MAG TPA: ROK family protein [Terriglobia bacterium]|nr:ROK family protein [Terriglobia bacterium]